MKLCICHNVTKCYIGHSRNFHVRNNTIGCDQRIKSVYYMRAYVSIHPSVCVGVWLMKQWTINRRGYTLLFSTNRSNYYDDAMTNIVKTCCMVKACWYASLLTDELKLIFVLIRLCTIIFLVFQVKIIGGVHYSGCGWK